MAFLDAISGQLNDKRQQTAMQGNPGSPVGFGFDPIAGSDGWNNPMGSVNNLFTDPAAMLQWALKNPNMQAMLAAGEANKAAASNYAASVYDYSAQKDILGKQRAAAAEARATEKARLLFQLDTSLRDGEQARESGLKGAINNALQRGIFRSGILSENKSEVNREADEFAADTKSQIDLALEALANQGKQQDLGFDMTLAGWNASEKQQRASAAQMAAAANAGSFVTLGDLEGIAENVSFENSQIIGSGGPTNTWAQNNVAPTYSSPSYKKPKTTVVGSGSGKVNQVN